MHLEQLLPEQLSTVDVAAHKRSRRGLGQRHRWQRFRVRGRGVLGQKTDEIEWRKGGGDAAYAIGGRRRSCESVDEFRCAYRPLYEITGSVHLHALDIAGAAKARAYSLAANTVVYVAQCFVARVAAASDFI